jgi:hypothetical protein
MNARIRQLTAVAGAVAVLWGSSSCGNVERTGSSPSFLVIDQLADASGVKSPSLGNTLDSDVITNVTTTINGAQVKVPTIFDDLGQVQLRILLKDQGGTTSTGATTAPSNLNLITITRYRVSYRRSDGRNVEGVDVPYAFEGAITATVTNTPVQLTFTLVRIQAKLEAPLRALCSAAPGCTNAGLGGDGGAIAISTIGDVTFYGQDQAGNDVSVTGSIGITFSDWGDPA